ncbi:MAG: HAD family acid phosphatase [Gemmatimonadaceae bacterium]
MPMKSPNRAPSLMIALSVVFALACAPAPRVAATPAAVANTPPSANDVKWSRTSAEHRAIFIETYRAAGERLATLATGHQPASWGVILDADETVLDNSEYEFGRIPFGGSFDAAGWTKWVMQGRAPALPGAVSFTSRVHELGGKVVIVTNRDDAECPITRSNLDRSSIRADLVLCKTNTDDKNPRFDAVQNGSAAPDFPALTVLEWVGDNIQDFPHLKQSIRDGSDAGFSRFGDSFFALPNPMYGSWQSNPLK